jgi:hypothetical protein
MLLSEPVIIPPENMLKLVAAVHPSVSTELGQDIRAWIMWIPPVILTSRSAYLEAIKPQRPPAT